MQTAPILRSVLVRPPRRLGLIALGIALAIPASGRDAYVLISGGGTPLTNHYSQYLQAKHLWSHLQATYPPDSAWVFFGHGNRPGEPVGLADVHKLVRESGVLRESWLPGILPDNRPATREAILGALRDEILPVVRDGGTLYLFVGDHGTLSREDPKESVITLWQMENKDHWTTNTQQTLGVTELRDVLAEGLGTGRVVFCMTQCHSGGFHFLGVPRTITPPEKWFSKVPDWAAAVSAKPLPAVAGFTAVDEASLAAGCDPDPDPDRWAGYERYMPEFLLGMDLFSGGRSGEALHSFAEAHIASVLVDQTIDKPRSSSEQYLEQWAEVIEKLAAENDLTPEARNAVAIYQQSVDEGLATSPDPAFLAKRKVFERFIERMGGQNDSARELVSIGNRETLEAAIGPKARPGGGDAPRPRGRRGNRAPSERTKPWTETIRPAWVEAVKAETVGGVDGAVLEFETFLQGQEDKGRDYLFSRGDNGLTNDLFWRSGYAFPDQMDAARAEAITRWGATRRGRIFEWAKQSGSDEVRAAAEKLSPSGPPPAAPPPRTLSTAIAADRALFYRRTLAAWAFLLAMDDQAALGTLRELIDLENKPLGSPGLVPPATL